PLHHALHPTQSLLQHWATRLSLTSMQTMQLLWAACKWLPQASGQLTLVRVKHVYSEAPRLPDEGQGSRVVLHRDRDQRRVKGHLRHPVRREGVPLALVTGRDGVEPVCEEAQGGLLYSIIHRFMRGW